MSHAKEQELLVVSRRPSNLQELQDLAPRIRIDTAYSSGGELYLKLP